jgi:RNA polymerase sigma factor (sigma-70 family)
MSEDTEDEQQRRIARLVDSLVRDYGSRLESRVLKIVHDREAAQLILQDTYEEVFRRLRSESVSPVRHPITYLYTAARTNALRYLRGQARQRQSGPEFICDDETARQVPDPAAGPERLAMLQEAMGRLSDIVDKMPSKQRQVFMLGVSGVLPHEIAKQLGLSPTAVHRLLTRANARCRKRLEQMGLDSRVEIIDGPKSH